MFQFSPSASYGLFSSRLRQGFLISGLAAVLLTSCSGGPSGSLSSTQSPGGGIQTPSPSAVGGASVDETQALQAQAAQAHKVEITCTLPVKRLLRDDTKGLPHQRFLLSLSNGSTILVAHDTAMAPRVPISEGDIVTVHGEYIWNDKGGVIHWTHHSDTPRHEGGYIDFQSQRYQ